MSNALVKINKANQQREFVSKQIDSLEKSVEYTNDLFQLTQSATYLEVLTARSSLLQAQLSALSCWHSGVAGMIEYYQAVGGGR